MHSIYHLTKSNKNKFKKRLFVSDSEMKKGHNSATYQL